MKQFEFNGRIYSATQTPRSKGRRIVTEVLFVRTASKAAPTPVETQYHFTRSEMVAAFQMWLNSAPTGGKSSNSAEANTAVLLGFLNMVKSK